MTNCIFCKIVKNEIPSYIIYEDKEFLGFLDIFPKTEGHTLVIPKKHVQWVWDYPELGKYFEVVGKIARHLRKVSPDKIVKSVIWGWEVAHAHIHLMPGKTDNLTGQQISGAEMERIQQKFSL
ncbi:HIT domain-containing protein [Microgenomates group bacterium]|nr:HIT domain-containing protein [Microgenomates group bacterium]